MKNKATKEKFSVFLAWVVTFSLTFALFPSLPMTFTLPVKAATDPVVISITPAETTMSSAGGNNVITVEGTDLDEGDISVRAVNSSDDVIVPAEAAAGSATSQTATLAFPESNSANNITLTVQVSIDGGANWLTSPTATVTVQGTGSGDEGGGEDIVTTHYVTFDSNYPDAPQSPSILVDDGDLLGALPTPTRAGYNLLGWFDTDAATGGDEYFAETPITENVTLYARWQAIIYDITYVLGDGGTNHASNPDTYTISTLITLLAPTRTGYTFTGWTWDGETTPTMTATIPAGSTGDKTFTAHWEINKYTVTFDSQGGLTVPAITDVNHGSRILAPPDPVWTGHKFEGWFTAASGGNIFSFTSQITDDITLYAQWTQLEIFTLSYAPSSSYVTGSVPANQNVYDGDWAVVAGAGNLEFTSFVFAGWSTDGTVDEVEYYPGQTITLTANTTLYAVWVGDFLEVPVTGIEIDGGDFSIAVGETKDLTVTFNPSNATNKGVIWTSSDELIAVVHGGRVTGVSEGTATITVKSINGDYTDTVTVTVGGRFTPVNQITGVNTEPFTAGTPHTLGGTVYPTSATNKEISWSIVTGPMGTTAPGAAVHETDGVVTATGAGMVVVRATIANGILNSNDTLGAYTQNFTITVNPSPTATVTFNYNYSGAPSNITYTLATGNALGAGFPANPTRTGYTFNGWFTVAAATGGTQFTAATPVNAHMTVYARWESLQPPAPNPAPNPEPNPEPGNGGNNNSAAVRDAIISGGGIGGGSGAGGGGTKPQPNSHFENQSDSFTKGSGEALTLTIDKNFADFQEVRRNGRRLTRGTHYTAQSGSTIITLLPEYLDTLEDGEHELSIHFSGLVTVNTSFTVANTEYDDVSTLAGIHGEAEAIDFAAEQSDAARILIAVAFATGAGFVAVTAVKIRRKSKAYNVK
ncbi:MAG: InlB B-repeat-containing protein [Oscillospiraceae bacterium]|nr:InlB B-repeat-containing protein [Oscillospiraceae bacterium]